jgi:hypothetical protein
MTWCYYLGFGLPKLAKWGKIGGRQLKAKFMTDWMQIIIKMFPKRVEKETVPGMAKKVALSKNTSLNTRNMCKKH